MAADGTPDQCVWWCAEVRRSQPRGANVGAKIMLATPGLVDETWIHWVPTLPGRGAKVVRGRRRRADWSQVGKDGARCQRCARRIRALSGEALLARPPVCLRETVQPSYCGCHEVDAKDGRERLRGRDFLLGCLRRRFVRVACSRGRRRCGRPAGHRRSWSSSRNACGRSRYDQRVGGGFRTGRRDRNRWRGARRFGGGSAGERCGLER